MRYIVIAGVCLILYHIMNIIQEIMWNIDRDKALDDALSPINEKWVERKYK